MRRLVKEQLKKQLYDVNFSYIDNETFEEHYVSVPEKVYTIDQGNNGMIGSFRLVSQMLPGKDSLKEPASGLIIEACESSNTAFNFLKANESRISGAVSINTKNYIISYQDLQAIG